MATADKPKTSPTRQNFVSDIIAEFDSLTPAVCIRGDTNDNFIEKDGTFVDVKQKMFRDLFNRQGGKGGLLSRIGGKTRRETQQPPYDFVIEYDASSNTISFGDEEIGLDDADQYMREEFKKLNIVIKPPREDRNAVSELLDKQQIKTTSSQMLDRIFLAMIRDAIQQKKKKCCVIIDDAQLLISAPDERVHLPSDRVMNKEVIIDFINFLRKHEGNHLILIDRDRDSIKPGFVQDVRFKTVPQATIEEIRSLLHGFIRSDRMQEATSLAAGMRIFDLRRFIKEHQGCDSGEVMKELVKFKEEQVQAMSGNVLKCSLRHIGRDMLAISDAEMAEWDKLSKQLSKKSESLPQGLMLMGPPGTGKSIRAEYLASGMGVPYLQMYDVGGEGLAGVKLKKFQRAFEAAMAVKPCVLFIDEVDKAWPRTEGARIGGGRDNDDAEVAAYVQTMMDSREMAGVVVVAACNDPEQMNEAMKRSGRFGVKVACLPPKNLEEKMKTFRAVWNQFDSLRKIAIDDETVRIIAAQPGVHTGADYKELVRRAHGDVEVGKFGGSMRESLLHHLKRFDFQKNERFMAMIETANRLDTLRLDEDENETKYDDPEMQKLSDLGKIAREWELKIRNYEQEYAKKTAGEEAELLRMEKERERLQQEIEGAQAELVRRMNEADQRVKDKYEETSRECGEEIAKLEKQLQALKGGIACAEAELEEKVRVTEEKASRAWHEKYLEYEKQCQAKRAELKTEKDLLKTDISEELAKLRDVQTRVKYLETQLHVLADIEVGRNIEQAWLQAPERFIKSRGEKYVTAEFLKRTAEGWELLGNMDRAKQAWSRYGDAYACSNKSREHYYDELISAYAKAGNAEKFTQTFERIKAEIEDILTKWPQDRKSSIGGGDYFMVRGMCRGVIAALSNKQLLRLPEQDYVARIEKLVDLVKDDHNLGIEAAKICTVLNQHDKADRIAVAFAEKQHTDRHQTIPFIKKTLGFLYAGEDGKAKETLDLALERDDVFFAMPEMYLHCGDEKKARELYSRLGGARSTRGKHIGAAYLHDKAGETDKVSENLRRFEEWDLSGCGYRKDRTWPYYYGILTDDLMPKYQEPCMQVMNLLVAHFEQTVQKDDSDDMKGRKRPLKESVLSAAYWLARVNRDAGNRDRTLEIARGCEQNRNLHDSALIYAMMGDEQKAKALWYQECLLVEQIDASNATLVKYSSNYVDPVMLHLRNETYLFDLWEKINQELEREESTVAEPSIFSRDIAEMI